MGYLQEHMQAHLENYQEYSEEYLANVFLNTHYFELAVFAQKGFVLETDLTDCYRAMLMGGEIAR